MSDTQVIVPPVDVAEKSDPGRDPEKQVNEDCCRSGPTPFGHLSVLCDGMGGHEGGREASTLAVEWVFRHVSAAALRPDIPPAARAREVLHDAIAVANQQVFAMSTAHGAARPGSTIVAALVHPAGTDIAHVGDSRCYLVQDRHIRQVTRDHSMVQQMVEAGVLTPEQAIGHPDANMITRALGMGATVEVELQDHAVSHRAGDTFVLCSDGLSDLVQDKEILSAVTSAPPDVAAGRLVDLANERGGHDNITVIIIRTREDALGARGSPADPMALFVTEAMPAVDAAALAAGGAPPPTSSRRSLASGPDPFLPLPVPLPSPRRRTSPIVLVGIVLGLIGVALAGLAIATLTTPRRDANDALDAAPTPALSIVLPAASFAPHVEPVDADVASVDAGAPPPLPTKRPKNRKNR